MVIRIRPERTLSAQSLRSVKARYRNCYFQGEKRLSNFKYYSMSTCELNCLAVMLLQNCKCVSYFIPSLRKNDTICSIYESSCVERTRLQAIRPEANQTSCLTECWPACNDLTYSADLFGTQLSNSGFKISNNVIGNISSDYVETNIAMVHLFFNDLTYRADKQNLIIGVTDFMASVGGLMGLFFGFSFISVAEIIYFGILLPIRKFCTASKTTKKPIFKRPQFNVAQKSYRILSAKKCITYKNNAIHSFKEKKPIIW